MIGVAVVGCGIVGFGVVEMLLKNREQIERSACAEVALTHVVDIREVGLPDSVTFSANLDAALASDDVRIVVETIGGTSVAYEYTKRALMAGRHVVSSNKALVAAHGDELNALARENGVRYLFEAAVGGGVPILRPIRTCLSGNRLTRVEGIINGSTNYLLTSMEKSGAAFPEALKAAQALGYVEGNPDADIEGWDARRKLAILAHTAFSANLAGDERIETEGIAQVTQRDIAIAQALGMRIKLIARARLVEKKWTGRVAPMLIPSEHPFFTVNGVINAICVHGDFVGDVLFQGQGAGSLATASAVVGDIIDAARHDGEAWRFAGQVDAPEFFVDEDEKMRFIARIEGAMAGKIAQEVSAVIEGAEAFEIGGMAAIKTPEMTRVHWMSAKRQLSNLGIMTGIGLGIYE